MKSPWRPGLHWSSFSLSWGSTLDTKSLQHLPQTLFSWAYGSIWILCKYLFPLICPVTLKTVLHCFQHMPCATKRQLQSLTRKLSHARRVIQGRCTFLHSLLNAINSFATPSPQSVHPRCSPWGYQVVSGIYSMFQWHSCLHSGRSCYSDTHRCMPHCYWCILWLWLSLHTMVMWPSWHHWSANYKEAMMVAIAVLYWAPSLHNRTVYLYTDNQCMISIINKCSRWNPITMNALRNLFW